MTENHAISSAQVQPKTDCRADNRLQRVDMGRAKYEDVWAYQRLINHQRAKGLIYDCIITVEHDPVLTMGRGTDKENLLVSPEELSRRGVSLFEIERGGDITFHGPGQAVVYPIIDLRNRSRDAHKYLRDLETVAISTLAEFGLEASIKKGLTGVWVNDKKVGAIGVALSHWVTYHGMAININTNLDYFRLINPCGITEYPVGSVADLLGYNPGIENFTNVLVAKFADFFGYNVNNINDPQSLISDRQA